MIIKTGRTDIFAMVALITVGLFAGCANDAEVVTDVEDVAGDVTGDASSEVTGDVEIRNDVEPCVVQFGVPNEKTGLTADQCQPSCYCGSKNFQPPVYTEDDIAALLAMVPTNPPAEVISNPWEEPGAHQPVPGSVCGLFRDESVPNGYRLQTFESNTAATDAGAWVTHYDGCGVCSTLVNLVVYMRNPDLTDPVRQCGMDNFGNKDGNIECLMGLGFDLPCAQIWYFNTLNTQTECFEPCIQALDLPYHKEDGTLNDCLVCDETKSGPVFKAVAGRNRRNTGLPSSMCRPCDEVQPVFHIYK